MFMLQVASLSWIWFFVLGITWWIITLLREALRLHDAPDASVVISIVVIPVFLTLASVLTYVFVGLQRHRENDSPRRLSAGSSEKDSGVDDSNGLDAGRNVENSPDPTPR